MSLDLGKYTVLLNTRMLVVQESSYTKENDGLVFEGRLGVLGDH